MELAKAPAWNGDRSFLLLSSLKRAKEERKRENARNDCFKTKTFKRTQPRMTRDPSNRQNQSRRESRLITLAERGSGFQNTFHAERERQRERGGDSK